MLRILCCVSILWTLAASGCSEPEKSADSKPPSESQRRTVSEVPEQAAGIASDLVARPKPVATKDTSDDAPPAGADQKAHPAPTNPPSDTQGPQTLPDDPQTKVEVAKWLEAMGSDATVERRAASDALDEKGEAAIPFVVFGLRQGTVAQQRGAATYLIGRASPARCGCGAGTD